MRWGKTLNEQFDWHWWFAWKPVKITDGRWAWMEGVSRMRVTASQKRSMFHEYNYRWWEDHVRAKMEGTDNLQVAAQRPATPGPILLYPKW